LSTPDGTPYRGFKVSVGGGKTKAEIERTYEDIYKIFKSNPGDYKIHEERDEKGQLKSYTVTT